jgi:enamine deaminase RidA (YjgF/YER057c/UK114 family)
MTVQDRLKEMGITLPAAPKPVAAYVPVVRAGELVFVSGQLPVEGGEVRYRGKVGQDLSLDDGYAAARACALNCLAVLNSLPGGLDSVVKVVKVTGFVNCGPDFADHAGVVNGASELLGAVIPGGHARAAVGVASLPLGAAVEVELIAQVRR